jgi:xanthine dehydrogenase accessory factor
VNPHQIILNSLLANANCVLVSVVATQGSTPRDVGAWMIVTPHGFHGTIGGGTLEWHAMAEAQNMLTKPATFKTISKILGPDLGQCCGGRMDLLFESYDKNSIAVVKQKAEFFRSEFTHVHVWGAGHVGRALVLALAPLPFNISWWDGRPNAFPDFMPHNITCRSGHPSDMEPHSMVVVMSHSHALDFEIVDVALRNPHFHFVGLIGSATKRARFINRLKNANVDCTRLTCPIGVSALRSKLPASIAADIAVQLLQCDEMLKANDVQKPLSCVQSVG